MAINKNNIIKAAQKFIEKGHLDKAIKEYEKIVQADPKDIRVMLKIGDLHVKKGALEKAADTYRKVAESYAEQGFNTRAAAVFKQVLKLAPKDLSVHRKLAALYRERGLVNDALMQMEVLYKTLMKMERYEEARDTVQEMVAMDEENVALRIRLAEGFSRDNMRKEAIEQFLTAARLLESSDRPEDYIKVAERLLWHDSENVKVSKELARRYLAIGEPRRALQKLQVAFKADSQDVETLKLLADSFEGLKQKEKAATILKELGKVLSAKGDREGSRKTYRKVLGLTPGDKEARKALAELEGVARDPYEPRLKPDLVRQPVARAVASGDGVRFEETGEIEEIEEIGEIEETGEVEEIEEIGEIEEIEEIEEILPDSIIEAEDIKSEEEEVESVLQDIDAFVKYSLYDKAIEHIQGFLTTYPENRRARECFADLLADSGRIPEAVDEYRALARLKIDGDKQGAVSLLDKALQLVPEDRGVAEELAVLTGRSASDILAAVAPDDGSLGDDFSELGGLRILEDIEAEAESLQPAFATQEISVSRVENLSRLGANAGSNEAATAAEDNLDDLESLGLLDDEQWSGQDVVDLDSIGKVAFGPAEPTLEFKHEEEPFGGVGEENFMTTTPGLDSSLESEEAGQEGEVFLPEMGFEAPGDEVEESFLAGNKDLDRELSALEDELGVLASDDHGSLPVAAKAPDTAVVEADSVEEPEFFGEDEYDLLLRPPEDEPVTDASDSSPSADDFLADELNQLEEAQKMFADLEEATGEKFSMMNRMGEARSSDEGEIDFSGLDLNDTGVEPDVEFDMEIGNEVEVDREAEIELDAEPAVELDAEPVVEPEAGFEKTEKAPDIKGLADSWGDDEPGKAESGQALEVVRPEEGELDSLGEEKLQDLRDEIEETEFFIAQELYGDALDMLEDLKQQFGEHPELMAKIQDIRAEMDKVDADGESAYGDEPVSSNERGEDLQPDVSVGGKYELSDVDDSLTDESTLVESDEIGEIEPDPSEDLPGRDAEVFQKFRNGVAEQVNEEDSETHFDLGIAYKEMGMMDAALEEFKKAMVSPEKEVQAHMLLAACYLEMNNVGKAVSEYKQALHSENVKPEEELDAYYQLGLVYEKLGDPGEALYYMEKVKKRMPGYRDVEERLQNLHESN